MKTLMSACLVLALAIPVLAWSQTSSQQSGNQSQYPQNQPNAQSQPNTQNQSGTQGQQGQQQMSGTVSKNGKTFTSDKDSKQYKVENPNALNGQEGEHVTVLVTQDPDTGDLHIIQIVTPAPPQS